VKLAGNILPPVSKSIDRVTDRVTGLLGEPESGVLKFGSLVLGQQQPELSPENTALLLHPKSQQDDDGELKITDEGEQELKLELTYSLGTQLIGQSPRGCQLRPLLGLLFQPTTGRLTRTIASLA